MPEERPYTATVQQRQTVLWIIAILLAVIATTLLTQSSGDWASRAFADSPMAGARGIFAFTGQLDKNSYGLFMIDVDARTVWCYQYLPATRKLKLVAARSFDYDRYLQDYNNDGPVEEDVKEMLSDQRRINARRQRGGPAEDAATNEDDPLGITVPGLPSKDEQRKPDDE